MQLGYASTSPSWGTGTDSSNPAPPLPHLQQCRRLRWDIQEHLVLDAPTQDAGTQRALKPSSSFLLLFTSSWPPLYIPAHHLLRDSC